MKVVTKLFLGVLLLSNYAYAATYQGKNIDNKVYPCSGTYIHFNDYRHTLSKPFYGVCRFYKSSLMLGVPAMNDEKNFLIKLPQTEIELPLKLTSYNLKDNSTGYRWNIQKINLEQNNFNQ